MKDIYVVEIPFTDEESAMDFVDVLNLIVNDDDPTYLRAVLGYMTLNMLLKDAVLVEETNGHVHDISADSSTQFYCSECECTVDVPLLWGKVNYCPNCGGKVIDFAYREQ